MSAKMSVKRTVLLLGTPLSGKTSLLDSLTILQAAGFGDKNLSLPSKRAVSINIGGGKKEEKFNINILVEEDNVDILEVKFIKMPSIDLNSENKYEQVHEYFQFLSEEDINLNTILYVYDGSQNRINIDDKIILQGLVTYYGESILNNLIIVQAKSNRIKPLDYEQNDEHIEDCTRQLNAKIKNLNSFYQQRFITRRKLFCQIIEDVLKESRNTQTKSQSTKNDEKEKEKEKENENEIEIKEMIQNINRPEMKSITNIIKKISYMDFGQIYLMEKNDKVQELKISNLPNYPIELTSQCNQYNVDYITNIDWVEVFYKNLLSHKTEINLYKKNRENIKYRESYRLAEINFKITMIAIKKAATKIKKNLTSLKYKHKFELVSDWLPLLRKLNPFANSHEYQENGILGVSKYIIGECISIDDISLIVKNITTTVTDEHLTYFKLFLEEVEQQKGFIKLKNGIS